MKIGMGVDVPPTLRPIAGLLDILAELAVEQAQRSAQRRKDAKRPRKGATLRPGADTPLWNAVVAQIRPHLRTRGTKTNLARLLEVPRQRVQDYFVSGTQMPDAERMIHLLLWLAARETPEAVTLSPKPLN
ncbi:hypothetical protein [Rariglobus hedericola]|uniref:Uncharacterized protein n=1 Tax=Rariglobus hedericola TaxID=2597822 RepID=A0A556QIZ6_9BACT|nr:hypothetical protein [Rariglobus hedericola]TSJ76608.1 hypothetical protein FPL22_10785 [Rariglobus hedericola]